MDRLQADILGHHSGELAAGELAPCASRSCEAQLVPCAGPWLNGEAEED
jgi:hypothetical protein